MKGRRCFSCSPVVNSNLIQYHHHHLQYYQLLQILLSSKASNITILIPLSSPKVPNIIIILATTYPKPRPPPQPPQSSNAHLPSHLLPDHHSVPPPSRVPLQPPTPLSRFKLSPLNKSNSPPPPHNLFVPRYLGNIHRSHTPTIPLPHDTLT